MRLQRVGSLILLFTIGLATTVRADDGNIARELADQLRTAKETSQLKDFRIGVKVENGVVWMKGSVTNKAQQQQALKLARRIAGVKLVVNDLDVDQSESVAAPQPASPSKRVPSFPEPAVSSAAASRTSVQQMVPSVTLVPSQPESVALAVPPAPTATITPPLEVLPVQHVMPSAAPRHIPAARPTDAATRANPRAGPANSSTPAPASLSRKVTYSNAPVPVSTPGRVRPVQYTQDISGGGCGCDACNYGNGMRTPMPEAGFGGGYAVGEYGGGVSYEQPQLPGHAWPSYAAYPNYGAVTYPKQYSPTAWPYIGPFYPYPQVPMGWRKVALEWDDGWWYLDFKSKSGRH